MISQNKIKGKQKWEENHSETNSREDLALYSQKTQTKNI
jgi:hypothetical protein